MHTHSGSLVLLAVIAIAMGVLLQIVKPEEALQKIATLVLLVATESRWALGSRAHHGGILIQDVQCTMRVLQGLQERKFCLTVGES